MEKYLTDKRGLLPIALEPKCVAAALECLTRFHPSDECGGWFDYQVVVVEGKACVSIFRIRNSSAKMDDGGLVPLGLPIRPEGRRQHVVFDGVGRDSIGDQK